MMDTWDLLILGVLGGPICAIAALVMAVGARSRLRLLEYRIGELEGRFFRLVGTVEEARPAEVQPEPVMPEPTEPEPEPAKPAEPEPLQPEEGEIEATKQQGLQSAWKSALAPSGRSGSEEWRSR